MIINSKTDKGRVREINQDSYNIINLDNNSNFVIVCDGMGGASGGNIASETAVKIMSESITADYHPDMDDNQIKSLMTESCIKTNKNIYELSIGNKDLAGMGTTVVAVLADSGRGCSHILHVGDSKAFLIRGNEIKQLTKDHSLVQVMIDRGQITPQEAMSHPKKNLITRALGVSQNIEVDFTTVETNKGDYLVVCTDGLSNHVAPERMVEIINQNGVVEAPNLLVDEANMVSGDDNITVVVIYF